jgi:cellulose synthase/poly-beta-1,6-N-acetylglucosamine synthase-like glycosyltransferase
MYIYFNYIFCILKYTEKRGYKLLYRFSPKYCAEKLVIITFISWIQVRIVIYIMANILYNATFSNISAISWRPVLVMEEARVPGENHRPWASNMAKPRTS